MKTALYVYEFSVCILDWCCKNTLQYLCRQSSIHWPVFTKSFCWVRLKI